MVVGWWDGKSLSHPLRSLTSYWAMKFSNDPIEVGVNYLAVVIQFGAFKMRLNICE